MQGKLEQLNNAGIQIVGVSYDPVSALKEFSDEYSIGYNLLSDADSAVIKEFGILNTLIEEDAALYGIPFPGVYVLDEEGLVSEKFFNRSYTTRNSAGSILNSALGEVLKPESGPAVDYSSEQIKFSAFLADPELKLEYVSTLYVQFQVADGLHIYADPLPGGFIPTTVTVAETKGLTLGEPKYPPTQMKTFAALGVELPVYSGVVNVAIPITANAEVLNWTLRDKPESIDIEIDVNYQVCSDTFCYLPKSEHLTMTVPLGPLLR